MSHIWCCCSDNQAAKLWITDQKLWINRADCGKVAQLFGFDTPISGYLFSPLPKSGLEKKRSAILLETLIFSPYVFNRQWITIPGILPSTG
jgi:hypothetical protein